jgi:hypothetical protein
LFAETFQATVLFGTGWLWFCLVLYAGLKKSGVFFSALPMKTKFGFMAAATYGIAVVTFLMVDFDVQKDSYWVLMTVPYAIIEIITLCFALAAGEKKLILVLLQVVLLLTIACDSGTCILTRSVGRAVVCNVRFVDSG